MLKEDTNHFILHFSAYYIQDNLEPFNLKHLTKVFCCMIQKAKIIFSNIKYEGC